MFSIGSACGNASSTGGNLLRLGSGKSGLHGRLKRSWKKGTLYECKSSAR